MADEDHNHIIAIAACSTVITSAIILMRRRKRRKRAMWVRPMFRLRQRYGAYQLLMAELLPADWLKH
jgi:hypothetical protein